MHLCECHDEAKAQGEEDGSALPLPPAYFKKVYADLVGQFGVPIQLLKGSPLAVAGSFLVDVLKDLGRTLHNRELLVISVIGGQSSAKSTLMNYLFGCGFTTAAGRCTKGLSGSPLAVQ